MYRFEKIILKWKNHSPIFFQSGGSRHFWFSKLSWLDYKRLPLTKLLKHMADVCVSFIFYQVFVKPIVKNIILKDWLIMDLSWMNCIPNIPEGSLCRVRQIFTNDCGSSNFVQRHWRESKWIDNHRPWHQGYHSTLFLMCEESHNQHRFWQITCSPTFLK